MRDARDAEDALLLQTGDYETLLAAWYPVVVQRCRIRVRGDAAWDVAQDVCLRLLGELRRGKRYAVPFRVVVVQVVRWTVSDHFAGRPTDVPLDENWDAPSGGDPFGEFESRHDLAALLDELPPGDAEVARLRYLDGLEIDEIAARLGKARNAVDQALWRAHAKLRALLGRDAA
jgi:RNA polymerase sigma-70 factor (ECF subfamily)